MNFCVCGFVTELLCALMSASLSLSFCMYAFLSPSSLFLLMSASLLQSSVCVNVCESVTELPCVLMSESLSPSFCLS